MDQAKPQAMLVWEPSSKMTELQSFMGLAN